MATGALDSCISPTCMSILLINFRASIRHVRQSWTSRLWIYITQPKAFRVMYICNCFRKVVFASIESLDFMLMLALWASNRRSRTKDKVLKNDWSTDILKSTLFAGAWQQISNLLIEFKSFQCTFFISTNHNKKRNLIKMYTDFSIFEERTIRVRPSCQFLRMLQDPVLTQ